jgi:phage terminase large subunit-like protein
MVFLFPPSIGRARWRVLRYVWTPEETLIERARRDRAPYDIWVQQGHLLTTPGPRINHAVIRETLQANRERFDIEAIGFDPWHADKLIDELVTVDGFDAEQVLEPCRRRTRGCRARRCRSKRKCSRGWWTRTGAR